MTQAVSRQPLIAEALVRARVSQCGVCGGLGQVSLRVLLFSPVSTIPLWLSALIYHMEDEQ
jgi:hypothetical protein